jgi:hypothetical protein
MFGVNRFCYGYKQNEKRELILFRRTRNKKREPLSLDRDAVASGQIEKEVRIILGAFIQYCVVLGQLKFILGCRYLAMIFNSTVIEVYDDIIRVSQRFIGCQILGYTALPPPLLWEPISISQAFLHDAKAWSYSWKNMPHFWLVNLQISQGNYTLF